jgi:hypothetical protein
MRIAVWGILGAAAVAMVSFSANAVPTGPALPMADPASNIQLVAGGCGPGWHPVPPHFTPWGRWIPPHCRPNHYWWP